jgi:hypothetical protein
MSFGVRMDVCVAHLLVCVRICMYAFVDVCMHSFLTNNVLNIWCKKLTACVHRLYAYILIHIHIHVSMYV